jgi:hypothetical protein
LPRRIYASRCARDFTSFKNISRNGVLRPRHNTPITTGENPSTTGRAFLTQRLFRSRHPHADARTIRHVSSDQQNERQFQQGSEWIPGAVFFSISVTAG